MEIFQQLRGSLPTRRPAVHLKLAAVFASPGFQNIRAIRVGLCTIPVFVWSNKILPPRACSHDSLLSKHLKAQLSAPIGCPCALRCALYYLFPNMGMQLSLHSSYFVSSAAADPVRHSPEGNWFPRVSKHSCSPTHVSRACISARVRASER